MNKSGHTQSMWFKHHSELCSAEETKYSGRWKYQICAEEWGDYNLFRICTLNEHKCHSSNVFPTLFSTVWGLTGTLLIISFRCTLFLCNGWMVPDWRIGTVVYWHSCLSWWTNSWYLHNDSECKCALIHIFFCWENGWKLGYDVWGWSTHLTVQHTLMHSIS